MKIKRVINIICVLILTCLLLCLFFYLKNKEDRLKKLDKEILEKQEDIVRKTYLIENYKKEKDSIQKIITIQKENLEKKEKEYVYIEKRHQEIIDSVSNLNIGEQIVFARQWLP